MTEKRDVIVVGGGIAGVSAAQEARYRYPDARVTLVSRENVPFYNKIALNTFWAGKKPRRQMHFYPLDWLSNEGIECHWDVDVQTIDPAEHLLVLGSNQQLHYEKLILATGANPVLPPIPGLDDPTVCPVWSLADAEKVRTSLPEAHSVAIIGGGVLGVEAAVELADLGKHVTLIEARETILPLHLNPRAAERYERFLNAKGIVVQTGQTVEQAEPLKQEWMLTLDNSERCAVDLVMVLAGVAPNIQLAREAGIDTNRGIIVDDRMVTSDPDILACGNCTELDGALQLLWNPARHQGKIAGANAFETTRRVAQRFETVHVKTPQMPLFIGGRALAEEGGDRVLVDDLDTGYRMLRIDSSGHVAGAIFLENADSAFAFERAISDQRVLSEELLNRGSVAAIADELHGHRHEYDPTTGNWVCQMCGYNHEGENPPDICPVCAVGKDQFLPA